MHSSRMHTTRSSNRQLWGGGGSASVHAGIHPPGMGLETPKLWAWRPPAVDLETPQCGPGDPPGMGLETSGQTPQPPPWVWAWRPPLARPLNFPLSVGLQTPQARLLNFFPWCGPGDPPARPLKLLLKHPLPWRPARHAGIPPARHAGIPTPLWTDRHV